MSTDLERRVHDELHARAQDAGAWRDGGAALRRTAAVHRARRLRATAVVGAAAVVVAILAGVSLGTGGRPDSAPPAGPTATPSSTPQSTTQPDPAWLQVPLTDDMYIRAQAAAGLGTSAAVVVSLPLGDSGRVGVLLADPTVGGLVVTTVTLEPGAGAGAVSGTSGRYDSWSSLVAQPIRDGDRTVLLVLVPPGTGDAVIATSNKADGSLVTNERFVDNRLAVLSVTSPDAVTRVQVLRQGLTVVDTIPASSDLSEDVPRTLERVVASSGGPPSQPVQVRTDGRTACRLTVGGWWDGPPYVPWNPFDDACATVDGKLHLLIAADRRYSSVAGLAPAGTTSVRLHWRSGSDAVSTVPVTTRGGVTAFVDSSGHRPDTLVRAEAVRAGHVIATAVPAP